MLDEIPAATVFNLILTPYLIVSSADDFFKHFGPRSGLTERQA